MHSGWGKKNVDGTFVGKYFLSRRHETVKASVWNVEWRLADVPTCFDGVGELSVYSVVLVERCHLYDGGAYWGRLVGHGVVHGAGEVGYVIVGVLHRHQDSSQVTVKWELLILDLRTNEGGVEAADERHFFLHCGSTELFSDSMFAAVYTPGLSYCFVGFFSDSRRFFQRFSLNVLLENNVAGDVAIYKVYVSCILNSEFSD